MQMSQTMAFGSSNLKYSGSLLMATLPNVPKYSDSFKASDKLGKRKTHSKDDVCAVQTPGSPKPWLLSSLVLCLCFPHSLSSSTLPGRVGCYRRGFWTAPLPAGPSPVLSLQT
ncbi:unnamed protein product [Rangifer tarandus platyrhynchus]|uniref:Uncharacterized protein n=2 Tax=Rangifer tarandus platyrhynchus TaxID=3082113 RepID=A0ABN8ZXR5_RANTA|nr:unnamed protein product [Rangifer tarandus platyrhynchus]